MGLYSPNLTLRAAADHVSRQGCHAVTFRMGGVDCRVSNGQRKYAPSPARGARLPTSVLCSKVATVKFASSGTGVPVLDNHSDTLPRSIRPEPST